MFRLGRDTFVPKTDGREWIDSSRLAKPRPDFPHRTLRPRLGGEEDTTVNMPDPSLTMQKPTDGAMREDFKQDVLRGLSACPKRLPCKHFYNERGSQLFDQICELEEYYLTRTEQRIMERYAGEMGEQIGPGVMLVEYGSGSSQKTRILLDHLPDPVAYVPVDISARHLSKAASRIAADYAHVDVLPVCADFTKPFPLPKSNRAPTHVAVYFPGSTIGNLLPAQAETLLAQISHLCGHAGGLLIGVDLQKDRQVLEAAYNDRRGVTSEFNLNLLHRIDRELVDSEIDVSQFEHHAFYNDARGRIEIYLRSRCEQTVQIAEREFRFAAGELVHTEYSHKYTIDGFAKLAQKAGLTLRKAWTDEREYFAVLHLAILS